MGVPTFRITNRPRRAHTLRPGTGSLERLIVDHDADRAVVHITRSQLDRHRKLDVHLQAFRRQLFRPNDPWKWMYIASVPLTLPGELPPQDPRDPIGTLEVLAGDQNGTWVCDRCETCHDTLDAAVDCSTRCLDVFLTALYSGPKAWQEYQTGLRAEATNR